jgi:hypothetical protein
MIRCLVTIAFLLLAGVAFAYETAVQTDWSGGDGVPGPVTDWGDTFDTSEDVDWSEHPGEVVLSVEALEAPIEHLVDGNFNGAYSVQAADVDDDGHVDVLCAAFNVNDIAWWENDGSGDGWTKHMVDDDVGDPESVFAADVNGDDDLDVVGAAYIDDEISWWENDGSGGGWAKHHVGGYFNGAHSVYAVDLDGDEDTDIIGAAILDYDVTWWENVDGLGTRWSKHLVDGDFTGAYYVCAADVDGDDDPDILGAAVLADDVAWWENNGSGGGWAKHTVDGNFDGASSVYAIDVDGDGDRDIVGSARDADDVAWWENNGSGGGWAKHTVDGSFDYAHSVFAADLDSDSDTDILGAAAVADDITWWSNDDGSGTSWTEHTVDGNFDGAMCVYAADVDDDDDTDVLGVCQWGNDVAWWEVTGFEDGRLTSSILDTGGSLGWGVVNWIDDVPADTSVAVEARASNNPGSMGSWVEITSEGDLSDYLPDRMRYLQYRLNLSTDDREVTPAFDWIRFSWSNDSAVEGVDVCASACGGGVLVGWTITGDTPPGLRVLRGVDGGEPVDVSGALPGTAERWLDRDAYDASDKGLKPLVYWLEVTESDGTTTRFGPTEAVRGEPEALKLALSDPYPSPASDAVTIGFTLPAGGRVELSVYDLAGRRVARLVDGELAAGRHEVGWGCAEVPSGVYLYRLTTDSGSLTKRLAVSR